MEGTGKFIIIAKIRRLRPSGSQEDSRALTTKNSLMK
jgi:hypothetical protein